MIGKINPCIWFDNNAREGAAFYSANFKGAKITAENPIVTEFEVAGQKFTCLNGGPKYQPNPSISFFYICETEEEIDGLWKAFLDNEGQVLMPLDSYPWSPRYGWIEDRFHVSWQLSLGPVSDVGQKVTPSLLFTGDQFGRAEEAIEHYSSLFDNSSLDGILRYEESEGAELAGKVKHAQFAINGQKFMAMESLPHNFGFSEGISLMISCETQEEIDHFWYGLTEGGQESMCGWLRDKFGVSWQVIPKVLGQLMSDPARVEQTARAFMDMRKFDIAKLIQAANAG